MENRSYKFKTEPDAHASRMEKDYAAMAPKMRRAWGSKEIEPQLLLFICFVWIKKDHRY